MKKELYMNSTLLLLVFGLLFFTVGISFSYFQYEYSSDPISSSSISLSLDYVGDLDINQILPLGTSKEDGVLRTNKVKLGEGSVDAYLDLYLDLNVFPEEFSSEGVKYEVWVDDEEKAYSSGNLLGAKEGDRVKILEGLEVTDTYKTLKIYIWIDGDLVGNELKNKTFSGKIVTSAGNITGAVR